MRDQSNSPCTSCWREDAAGVTKLDRYDRFAEQVRKVKRDLLAFLIDAKAREIDRRIRCTR